MAQVANKLEREVIASSIYGTNTIEGGALTEDETRAAMDLDPAQVQEIEQRRVLNIKAAYTRARQAALDPAWALSIDFITTIHGLVTQDVPHADNRPGLIRNNPKGRITHVGSPQHGGRYKPPQYERDIWRLLEGLIAWHQQLVEAGVHPLVRAPLVHYYYELIHPFWDGNGRVGRVIEATLLQAAGYEYAPFALARYYLDNIDAYFTLFNTCRKAAEKHQSHPNTAFVLFHQEGMLLTINALHDRVNRLVSILLFQSRTRELLDSKAINSRQYTIVSQLLTQGRPVPLGELRHTPWYASLYLKLNDKTRSRDLKKLRELELLVLDQEDQLWPGCVQVRNPRAL
ncbi:Fic family protein [Aromatoleum evansii]|uniref:Fic family protein n=1 Tax=Aromatoleum evansii TaxID=59406 RepID=UPI001FEB99B5|nr:Fic family protein [Aromatoleum evansii]